MISDNRLQEGVAGWSRWMMAGGSADLSCPPMKDLHHYFAGSLEVTERKEDATDLSNELRRVKSRTHRSVAHNPEAAASLLNCFSQQVHGRAHRLAGTTPDSPPPDDLAVPRDSSGQGTPGFTESVALIAAFLSEPYSSSEQRGLSPSQQAVAIATWLFGLTHTEMQNRFDISASYVDSELAMIYERLEAFAARAQAPRADQDCKRKPS